LVKMRQWSSLKEWWRGREDGLGEALEPEASGGGAGLS
jgi:hypothetical protein